ncbi:MAG TPA: malto-oligosyltrehalose synthase [Propionibacteriaceae bacterium]|nr:malto-oligosyltrehalose synthase [Propionibacteriaceae bacterium]
MPAPTSTYRLQVRESFTLHDAAGLVDYLDQLGVDAVYLSPVLASTRGSDHGYDTVDVSRIDPARGGEEGWQALRSRVSEAGRQIVMDIVPNHLGVADASQNPQWWDVLRHGPQSAYAHWFDIDWSRGRLLLPVLGDPGPEGEHQLQVVEDELRYFEHRFPLAPGSAERGDDPAEVHDRQHYELVNWRRGNSEINYRRFFAVTTLAGVRVEEPDVFEATHAQVLKWVDEGIAGLRIDHPDGLVDPADYLERLRSGALDTWIVVEKILEADEELPRQWPVEGTTGYDAMREVNGVFVDPAAEDTFTRTYQEVTGDLADISDHIERAKRQVASVLLRAEVRRIAALVEDLDQTLVADALIEAATAMEVYRSYLPAGRKHLDRALLLAATRAPELTETLADLSPRLHDPVDEVARRFQQLSGAVMAKGVEDTAYYRYSRFVALNEVGGDPGHFGVAPAQFHALQQRRQADQPYSMTSLSTHDTKRGEDVRARLAVLSELPAQWRRFATLLGSSESAERFRVEHPGYGAVSPAYEYLLRQVVVGAGPIERDRMHAYLEKSIREAWDGTSWDAPEAELESAAHALVDHLYDDAHVRAELDSLWRAIEAPGWSNSLGQKLVQLTMPGIPDVYQGTELWEDSLVDPDNRRPVDFAARRSMLAAMAAPGATPPAVDASGAAKLWVTARTLRLRRDTPEALSSYTSLSATGSAADHLLAYDRGGVIAVATRLPVGLADVGGWGETSLALPGAAVDVLTGRQLTGDLAVADLLATFPVALLLKA